MATRYELDSESFPRDPLQKRWSRQPIATRGTGEPIYSAFWQVELSFGTLDVGDEVSFFEEKWLAGGLHTATLAHPRTGAMVGFTGVAIQDFSYEFNDIDSDSWAVNPRLLLTHIDLAATGTS